MNLRVKLIILPVVFCAVLLTAIVFFNESAVYSRENNAGSVYAGVATTIITPTAEMMDPEEMGPIYLGGYGQGRTADPEQVWHDLTAGTLVVNSAGTTVAFTAVDSIGIFYRDAMRIQELAREQLEPHGIKIDHIIVSASHTHHAPDTMGMWGASLLESGCNPHYQEFIIEKTAETIAEAALNMQPVEISFGTEETSGLIRDTRDPQVMDENIYVMHTAGPDGKAIATLVKWASHPETILGFYDEVITPDYVHFLRETVETETGAPALFFNGAIGGLLTSLHVDVGFGTDKEASIPTMEYIGREAGRAAVEAILSSEPGNVDGIVITRKDVYLPLENPMFYLAGILGVLERDLYMNAEKFPRKTLPPQLGGPTLELLTEVSAVTIGDGQFVMIPGELYPEIALGGYLPSELAQNPDAQTEPVIREHMTGKYNFIIGMANDEIGYIVPANDFVPMEKLINAGEHRVSGKKLYGEENSVGPSTAPILAQAVIDAINGDSSSVLYDNKSIPYNIPVLIIILALLACIALIIRRSIIKKSHRA